MRFESFLEFFFLFCLSVNHVNLRRILVLVITNFLFKKMANISVLMRVFSTFNLELENFCVGHKLKWIPFSFILHNDLS